jgi:hypothetical protein
MKILPFLILVLFTIIFTNLQGQNNYFRKLTKISIDYYKKDIDTTVYYYGEIMPFTSILDWEMIGKEGFPITYNEFIPGRKLELDSTRTKYGKNKGVYEQYVYNEITGEWFLHIKTKRTIFRKVHHWITFYHEYHKMYFTTRTDFKFNKNGRLVFERTVDTYLHKTKNEVYYKYD